MTDQQATADTLTAPPAAPSPGRRRPRLRTVLRWGAAVLLLGLSGTAAAFAVAAPDRTDLPGLRTPADGRYTFPQPTLPPLPAGKPAPSAVGNSGIHYADLRGLLLPAPQEATGTVAPAPAATSAAGCAPFAEQFTDSAAIRRSLTESACRRGTGRVWTASDGTRTEIRLVGFGSEPEARELYTVLPDATLKAVPDQVAASAFDVAFPSGVSGTSSVRRQTVDGVRRDVARTLRLRAGDLVATVVMTNPEGVPDAAFRQVVSLQAGLLG
ncbi:hypothetical protein ACIQGZ_01825 [Streptomyces sp. NPDC092296]|uniref:hypothetical protein n=1 Tax=Streptomyces sp. NPDC092296 TaxID=3366012 RepID=UPI0038136529